MPRTHSTKAPRLPPPSTAHANRPAPTPTHAVIHWPWDSASKGNVTNNATTSSVPLCNHTSPLFDERLCRLDTWQGMLDIFATGRARAVGVSNYNVSHFEEIVAAGMPLPALTQNPFHLYRSATQSDVIDYANKHGITFLGYCESPSPLKRGPRIQPGKAPPNQNAHRH